MTTGQMNVLAVDLMIGLALIVVGVCLLVFLWFACTYAIWIILGLYFVIHFIRKTGRRIGYCKAAGIAINKFRTKISPQKIRDVIMDIL